MTQPAIKTERLELRPIAADDGPLLVELDSDPEVMRFITGGRPSTAKEVAETIAISVGHRWLAFERSGVGSGRFVGWFGLGKDPEPDERQLGYRLAPEHWGHGLATEGAQAMVAHGFETLRLRRIWAQTMTINHGSRAVMDRCGMRFVRVFHGEWDDPIDGAEQGDVIYEIMRADWASRQDIRRSEGHR